MANLYIAFIWILLVFSFRFVMFGINQPFQWLLTKILSLIKLNSLHLESPGFLPFQHHHPSKTTVWYDNLTFLLRHLMTLKVEALQIVQVFFGVISSYHYISSTNGNLRSVKFKIMFGGVFAAKEVVYHWTTCVVVVVKY